RYATTLPAGTAGFLSNGSGWDGWATFRDTDRAQSGNAMNQVTKNASCESQPNRISGTPKDQSTSAETTEPCSPWLLFAMPIGLGVFLGFIVTAVNAIRSIDARAFYLGLDGLRPILLIALIGLPTIAILLCCFRPRLRTVIIGSGALAAILAFFCNCVRIESFYGNMVPRLAWAWTPTIEDEVDAFFVSRESLKSDNEAYNIDTGIFTASTRDFSSFLGASSDGIVREVALSDQWEQTPPELLWSHPVGLGWSGFATVGRAAINLEQRGENECTVCYNLLTGTEIWSHAQPRRFIDEHGDGPRSTPCIADGRVYTVGAEGLLSCLNVTDGTLIWSQETLGNPTVDNLLWGMSGSPLVLDGKVYVTPGGENNAVICFDAETGMRLWSAGDDRGGYASPTIQKICGTQQLLSFNGAGLRAFSLDGTPLWFYPWVTQGELQRVNVAQPIVVSASTENSAQVAISSGYGKGTTLLKVQHRGRESGEERWDVEPVWLSKRLKSKMSNFIEHDGFLYGLDAGIMTCIDAATGNRMWKRGRYGHGQMLMAGVHILVLAEDGMLHMIEASPNEHLEAASLQALDGKTWNHLALAGNILVIRNDHMAAAYQLPIDEQRFQ
ncbi:MAG: PQQ-binding-like beta-propeller repeat protein, partial [Planctomycetota bacterium]